MRGAERAMRNYIRTLMVFGLCVSSALVCFLKYPPLSAQAQEENLSLGEKPGVFEAEVGAFQEAAEVCTHENKEILHESRWSSAIYDKNRYHVTVCSNPVCDNPPQAESHLPVKEYFMSYSHVRFLFTGAYHREEYICRDCRNFYYTDFYLCRNQGDPDCTECLEEIYEHILRKANGG